MAILYIRMNWNFFTQLYIFLNFLDFWNINIMLCVFYRKQHLNTERFHRLVLCLEEIVQFNYFVKQRLSNLFLELNFELKFLDKKDDPVQIFLFLEILRQKLKGPLLFQNYNVEQRIKIREKYFFTKNEGAKKSIIESHFSARFTCVIVGYLRLIIVAWDIIGFNTFDDRIYFD